jgi:adenylate kinase
MCDQQVHEKKIDSIGENCSLVVIALGAPGSGKGTQCTKLAELLHIPHICSGDMLRAHLRANSKFGGKAKEAIARGGLVADDLVLSLVFQRISAMDCAGGFILDGFPRTVEQAQALDGHLFYKSEGGRFSRKIVLQLVVRNASLLKRLSRRRVCPTCASVFNGNADASSKQESCIFDGSQLVTREDDSEEAITRRLQIYEQQTLPILCYYAGCMEIVKVDGDQPVDAVTAKVLRAIICYSGEKAKPGGLL